MPISQDPGDEYLFDDEADRTDWLEGVNLFSPSQLSIGRKSSSAVLVGYVPYEKLKGMVRYLMGYSSFNSSLSLIRKNPAMHPIWSTLYAAEIQDITGVKFVSKATSVYTGTLQFATYTLAKITCRFNQTAGYLILNDDDRSLPIDNTRELGRYVSLKPKPHLDQLEMPGGTVLYDAPGQPFDNKPLLMPKVLIRNEQTLFTLTHHQLPLTWLANDQGFYPKLTNAIGKVSSDVFLGEQPGCWLLEDADVEIYGDPINGDYFRTRGLTADMKLTLRYQDPERGNLASAKRGFGVFPAYDGKFYPTKLAMNVGRTFPEETSFTNLFTHWNNVVAGP